MIKSFAKLSFLSTHCVTANLFPVGVMGESKRGITGMFPAKHATDFGAFRPTSFDAVILQR